MQNGWVGEKETPSLMAMPSVLTHQHYSTPDTVNALQHVFCHWFPAQS